LDLIVTDSLIPGDQTNNYIISREIMFIKEKMGDEFFFTHYQLTGENEREYYYVEHNYVFSNQTCRPALTGS